MKLYSLTAILIVAAGLYAGGRAIDNATSAYAPELNVKYVQPVEDFFENPKEPCVAYGPADPGVKICD